MPSPLPPSHPIRLIDAQRAIRTLRTHGKDWDIKQVGILGFSADGHLGGSAAPLPFVTEGMVGDAIDQAPYRPNFAILLYQALRRNGVPSELHIYERGKHGIGLANNHPWGSVTLDWLENR